VRAELARLLEISETEVRHYQTERGISDDALQMPRWRDQLHQYVIRCKRGIAEPQTAAGDFIWRFAKFTINSRGFATNANLRRAAERVALAAGAAVEICRHDKYGRTAAVTLDRCSVILALSEFGAVVVTAFAHEPMPTSYFLEVASRVTATVELHQRLRGLA
jgi:hypothetical protein